MSRIHFFPCHFLQGKSCIFLYGFQDQPHNTLSHKVYFEKSLHFFGTLQTERFTIGQVLSKLRTFRKIIISYLDYDVASNVKKHLFI